MNGIINIKIVSKVLSRNLFILTISLLVCIFVALIFAESVIPFLLTGLISGFLGTIFFFLASGIHQEEHMRKKDTYFTVSLSWVMIGLIGSLPYIISGSIPSFIDAYFESVSGFSTTGASILTDIEVLPRSILFWRSLTHWIGGIGIIVLVIIIMPSLKIGGYHLFSLESSLQEKIKPRIRAVGYRLLWIYIGLTAAEIVLLLIGKMSLFESVCHSFGTIATGGFSPKNTSIIDYSPYIQYVIMIFMLLAGTNFLVHYYLIKGDFRKIWANEEVRFYVLVILAIGIILTSILYLKMGKPVEGSFREAFFQIISIVTCTGFASADYLQWPAYGWMIIFFAMFLGGCTGSTAGGIKIARHVIFLKNIRNIFRHINSPHAVVPLRLNANKVSPETNNTILTFITVYMIIFFIGTTLLIILGSDIQTSGSAVATCMAGIGPGIGTVGPVSNYAHIPGLSKIILAFLMIIGRLEIFTIIILFSPGFWKK
jgi:trk system potassium uptake protein TrkH